MEAREFARMGYRAGGCGEPGDGGVRRSSRRLITRRKNLKLLFRIGESGRRTVISAVAASTARMQPSRYHDAVMHSGNAHKHRDAITANLFHHVQHAVVP